MGNKHCTPDGESERRAVYMKNFAKSQFAKLKCQFVKVSHFNLKSRFGEAFNSHSQQAVRPPDSCCSAPAFRAFMDLEKNCSI